MLMAAYPALHQQYHRSHYNRKHFHCCAAALYNVILLIIYNCKREKDLAALEYMRIGGISDEFFNKRLHNQHKIYNILIKTMSASVAKPKGRMSAYTFFVQTCREEHRENFPSQTVNFTDFSRQCASRWKAMTEVEKQKFQEMASKDKIRYQNEMQTYTPAAGDRPKRQKDPNAPKRPLSAFFLFCADERSKIRTAKPGYSVGDVAKELGVRWANLSSDSKQKYFERQLKDKARYEREMNAYGKVSSPTKKRRTAKGRDFTRRFGDVNMTMWSISYWF
ncbi:hypothetical protein GJ496_005663 [Pomphorhynchus laevis]|nr:hypothetical protein GJ496_005663 [Pomphorhynchus laevis]